MTQTRFRVSPGVAFAIAAPLLYSATIPFSKVFLNHVDPWMLAGLLDLTGGLSVGLTYLLRRAVAPHYAEPSLQRHDWKWLWGSIFAGGLLAPVLQTFGIAYSSAASASLLLNLEGVFTALIAWSVFKEAFDQRIAWGLAIITFGSSILVWSNDSWLSLSWGSLAIAGASLGWATSSNLTKKVADKDPLQVVMFRIGVSGTLNVLLAMALGNSLPPLPLLGAIALVGCCCVGSTFLFFTIALRHIGTARAGTFFSLFPFSGAALAVITLGEPVTPRLLIAACLMLIGLWFCLQQKVADIKPSE